MRREFCKQHITLREIVEEESTVVQFNGEPPNPPVRGEDHRDDRAQPRRGDHRGNRFR